MRIIKAVSILKSFVHIATEKKNYSYCVSFKNTSVEALVGWWNG